MSLASRGRQIEKAFGPKMDHLMRMQLAFDLARQRCSTTSLDLRAKKYDEARDLGQSSRQ